MQIFSKLQRSSAFKTAIKLLFYFLLAVANGSSLAIPWLMGYVFYKESLVVGGGYIIFFSIFHNLPILKSSFILIMFFFFKEKIIFWIKAYINEKFQIIIGVYIVYLLLFVLFLDDFLDNLILILFYYNLLFDTVLLILEEMKEEVSED
jgi:hypothetical protein